MDNKIFNVNGRTKRQLDATIELALLNEYDDIKTVNGWKVHPEHGLVLLWHVEKDANKFPVPLDAKSVSDIAWAWLQTDEAKQIPNTGWDADADHDGSNKIGFRVYCTEWGMVGSDHYSIVAIKPAYCWYGK